MVLRTSVVNPMLRLIVASCRLYSSKNNIGCLTNIDRLAHRAGDCKYNLVRQPILKRTMSRRSNSELRRAEIVSALLAVMSRHGYEKATVQLIAQQAGLTPGLLHYHFKTKAEILLELVRKMASGAQSRYDMLQAAAQTPNQRLQAYIFARLGLGEGADASAVAAWVIIGAEAVRQPEVREVYQQAAQAELAVIKQLLTACLKQRGKQLKNVTHLAASLLAYMEGTFQLASAAPEAMPTGYAADMALQLALRYMDFEPDAPSRARS